MKNQNIAFMLKRKELSKAKSEAERIAILRELVGLNPKDSKDLEQRTKYKGELSKLLRKRSSFSKGHSPDNPYAGIKYDRQIVLLGVANSGRSTLLHNLTGVDVVISEAPYTTYQPEIGMGVYNDVSFQVVELPPIYAGDNDTHKYRFLRNSDVVCITARNQDEADLAQSTLEDHLVIPSSDTQDPKTHKHCSKNEIIEKPSFIASWSHLGGDGVNVVDINSVEAVGAEIYRLLGIQRMYCFRDGQVEGNPITFPLGIDVTVGDFADNLGITRVKGAKIYGLDTSFEGQKVGLSYVLNDGDKVWLK